MYDDIIERAKTRHGNGLSSKQTRFTSLEYSVYYASKNGHVLACNPQKFTEAGLGILPIARHGLSIEKYSKDCGKDWTTQYKFSDWNAESWKKSWGIQVYTGLPSNYLTDLDFEYAVINDYPSLFLETLKHLCELTSIPIVTISKSGGVRFTCRTPNYLHSNQKCDKEYIGVWESQKERTSLYLEIFSEKGLSRWDARYEIVEGDLFNIPVIESDKLFSVIDNLKNEIHVAPPEKIQNTKVSIPKEKPKNKFKYVAGLPIDLEWIKSGNDEFKSRRGDYPCEVTKHKKSHGSAQFYLKQSGEIQAYCHNCGKGWKVRGVSREEKVSQVRSGQISHLALSRKKSKLKKEVRSYALLDTVAKAGGQIAKVLKSASRVFAFRAETGAGKNYQTESYALNVAPLLQTSPTNILAEDLETRMRDRFVAAGMQKTAVFRWRGLTQKSDNDKAQFPHEKPCIQPKITDIYRSRGGNIYKTICPHCSVKTECHKNGYLSQLGKVSEARAVLLPIPDAFTNPTFRKFTNEFLNQDISNRLCIVDEVDIFSLFVKCSISRNRLYDLRDMWNGCELGEFAKNVINFLKSDDYFVKIEKYIENLSDKQRNDIHFQMQRVRLYFDDTDEYRVYTLDDAVTKGLLDASSESSIKKLPQVDSEFTTLEKLEMFFDKYKRLEDAPISYHKNVLEWFVFPKIHNKVKKIGFMSATLNLDLFKRVFPDAQTLEIPRSQWVSGSRCFQLRTAKNPRATVMKRNAEGKFESLKKSGLKLWQMMISEIQKTPHLKHGIITYKDVLKWADIDIKELGITATVNYGGLVGLDTEFRDVDCIMDCLCT